MHAFYDSCVDFIALAAFDYPCYLAVCLRVEDLKISSSTDSCVLRVYEALSF